MADKITTLPISLEVNELIIRLAAKKAEALNLPRLSRTAFVEMLVKNQADKEL